MYYRSWTRNSIDKTDRAFCSVAPSNPYLSTY